MDDDLPPGGGGFGGNDPDGDDMDDGLPDEQPDPPADPPDNSSEPKPKVPKLGTSTDPTSEPYTLKYNMVHYDVKYPGQSYDWLDTITTSLETVNQTYDELAAAFNTWVVVNKDLELGKTDARMTFLAALLSGTEAFYSTSVADYMQNTFPSLGYHHQLNHWLWGNVWDAATLSADAQAVIAAMQSNVVDGAPPRRTASLPLHHITFEDPIVTSETEFPLNWDIEFDHSWLFKITLKITSTVTLFKINDSINGAVKSQYVAGGYFYISSVFDAATIVNSHPLRVLGSDGTYYLQVVTNTTPYQQNTVLDFKIRYTHTGTSTGSNMGKFEYMVNDTVIAWEETIIPSLTVINWSSLCMYANETPNEYYQIMLQ